MRAYLMIAALAVGVVFVPAHTASTQDRPFGLTAEHEADNGIGAPPPINPVDYDDDDDQ